LGAFGSPESRRRYAEFIALLDDRGQAAQTGSKQVVTSSPTAGPTAPLLVGEVALRFFEHAKVYYRRNGKPTGEATTVRACLRPLTNRLGDLPASGFGAAKLKAVRADMIGLGWTRSTINKAVSIIKRLFRWAAQEELVSSVVAANIWTVRGLEKDRSLAREKSPVGPVADEIVEATLEHVSDRIAALVRILRMTGMRPGEALNMKASEIDKSNPACWIYRPRFHKTSHRGKDRQIMIGPRAQSILAPWILKAGTDGSVFSIRRDSLRQAIHRGCQRAGVPNWHPNQIRPTIGTQVRSEFGLEAAQVLLGHSKADTTQVYAERDQRHAADIARKIG
jgi:integrase